MKNSLNLVDIKHIKSCKNTYKLQLFNILMTKFHAFFYWLKCKIVCKIMDSYLMWQLSKSNVNMDQIILKVFPTMVLERKRNLYVYLGTIYMSSICIYWVQKRPLSGLQLRTSTIISLNTWPCFLQLGAKKCDKTFLNQ